jgi:hypothetical protein
LEVTLEIVLEILSQFCRSWSKIDFYYDLLTRMDFP